MSLNGLDAPELKGAHDAAVAEAGGWFLLQYASRDAVELLGRGSGGIDEIRNAIALYDEPSPLYGFLRYRRRSVIIKYLPPSCSRLVQARVSVHLDSICERFSPHDTVFEIAAAKDLKDTRLSAACSLHAASGSTSSSTSSLRRRRLIEIAEEEEEEQRASKRQSACGEEAEPQRLAPETPLAFDEPLVASLGESRFSTVAEPPTFVGTPRSSSPARSLGAAVGAIASYGSGPDPSGHGSHLSSAISARPRVKLGPRPSLDIGGRPRTANGNSFRPVSTIPAGFKMMSKASKKDKWQAADREPLDSEGADDGDEAQQGRLGHLGDTVAVDCHSIQDDHEDGITPSRPHTSAGRPAATAGVKASLKLPFTSGSATTSRPALPRQILVSPEKTRLIKAMQLRERKKREGLMGTVGATASTDGGPTQILEPDISNPPSDIATGCERAASITLQGDNLGEKDGRQGRGSNAGAESETSSCSRENVADDVAFAPPADHASLHSQADSHPTSPLDAFSGLGDSTNALYVSQCTEETVREPEVLLPEETNTNPSGENPIQPDVTQSTEMPTDCQKPVLVPQSHQEPVVRPTAVSAAPSSLSLATSSNGGAHFDGSTMLSVTIPTGTQTPSPNITTPELPALSTQQQHQDSATENSIGDCLRALITPQDDILERKDREQPPAISAVPHAESDLDRVDAVQSKGKGPIEPIQTDLAACHTNLSDDEDLMDELQSATLQEAKPIVVSKSPITPTFPGPNGGTSNNVSASPYANAGRAIAIQTSTTAELSASMNTPPLMVRPDACPPTRKVARAVSNPSSTGALAATADASHPHNSATRAASSGPVFLQRMTQKIPASSPPSLSVPGSVSAKKTSLGSSISQRIKALEKLSSAAVASQSPGGNAERPQSTFFSVRQPSLREPSRSPSVAERASSLRGEKTPSPPRSRDRETSTAGGLRERSGSISSRLSVFEGGSLPRGRPESIQVTARIVRDPAPQCVHRTPEPRVDNAEPVGLDLKHSQLVIDHQRAVVGAVDRLEVPVEPAKATLLQRRLSRERRRSQSTEGAAAEDKDESESVNDGRSGRRSSLTIMRDFIKDRRGSLLGAKSPSADNLNVGEHGPAATPSSKVGFSPSRSPSRPPSTHHNSVFPRRLSTSSQRSSLTKEREGPVTPLLSPSHPTEASGSGDEGVSRSAGDQNHKKSGSGPTGGNGTGKSRASRFIRRLSNSLSSSRKNVTPTISPTVAEETYNGEAGDHAHLYGRGTPPRQPHQPAIVAYMGDVNVQFPDNLLWKRRTLCLDSQGFLILSAVQGVAVPTTATAAAGAVKRYHLSDFRVPYAPEMEQQELPNSVCLEFNDGSSLQIACEDRAGQMGTLQALQAAHRSHTTFGQ